MFEQTFLTGPKSARKPYSMALSLIFQIVVLGAFCLVPFVFTQVLPTLQMKSVLAAPPKPPVLLKARRAATHNSASVQRVFRLSDLLRVNRQMVPTRVQTAEPMAELAAPEVGGDPNGVPNGAAITMAGMTEGALTAAPEIKPKTRPQGPVRIASIAPANLLHKVQPVYPPLARASRIQGVVEFSAVISKEGTIENLSLVRGHPLLINAARDAVLQWRYRPTLLNGQPVEVITDIVVNFTLNQ